ncbi:hypothetical protein ABG768_001635 [Culter alburnus]|uniref:Ribonuclease A-domain domain-containing protein n=1 Tax=Culter alburnus TaxID=194366 RepID=A0AAW2A1M0_CULAL
MEIHQSAVILLLILSVSSFTHAQPDYIKPRYIKFLNQHYGPSMTVKKCDSVIHENKEFIHSETVNGCKEINTFIQANSDHIRASNQPFPVITCKLQSGERPPHCKYRGVRDSRDIVLRCDHGWPVHYDEGIYRPNNVG